jgi:hypothetical protein
VGAIVLPVSIREAKREIPRVWEVDWAIPPAEGGTPWEAYHWLLQTAADIGATEVSVLGSTYDNLGGLNFAIGAHEAANLRSTAHGYRVGGITVRAITRRGSFYVRGPVLVAWATDEALAVVEGQNPPAIAAVATWPDDIASWRSVYAPERIGQVRPDQEAEFDTVTAQPLDPRAQRAIDAAAALVNEHHSVLATYEREGVAGAFVALRAANVPVDRDAVRAYLMAAGWNGKLIEGVVTLAERVARGETPRHRRMALDRLLD